MDKKVLYGLLDDITANVAEDNQLNMTEARTFVGVALRRGKDAFLKTVVIPQLAVATDQEVVGCKNVGHPDVVDASADSGFESTHDPS